MLYVGVTGDIHRRMLEHKNKLVPGYSANYNLHRLVHVELFGNVHAAIEREKELKGWLRAKKVALIQATNPAWKDLAANWFAPANQTKFLLPKRLSPSKPLSIHSSNPQCS